MYLGQINYGAIIAIYNKTLHYEEALQTKYRKAAIRNTCKMGGKGSGHGHSLNYLQCYVGPPSSPLKSWLVSLKLNIELHRNPV